MRILGVKFLGHDSSVALIDTDKRSIFAISTERVTRIKHDHIDISAVLEAYQIKDIDLICHSFSNFNCMSDTTVWSTLGNEKELALRRIIKPKYVNDLNLNKNQRNLIILKSIIKSPINFYKYIYSKFKLFVFNKMNISNDFEIHRENLKSVISKKTGLDWKSILFYDHHLCHAIAAFTLSGMSEQRVLSLTLDGQGDGSFSKLFLFNKDGYNLVGESPCTPFSYKNREFIVSIGELYGNFTEALGLRRLSDEGKVEAMAAYAKPNSEIYNQLREAFYIKDNGIFFHVDKISKFYDIGFLKSLILEVGDKSFSASIQNFLEDIAVDYLNHIGPQYPDIDALCLSGGVAANIIMSLNIYERTQFRKIYVLPCMGDEGTALGAAILGAVEKKYDVSWLSKFHMPYYGDAIASQDIINSIKKYSDRVNATFLGDSWYLDAAREIKDGKILALVHGRMEFGPRALGNRSIVANPTMPHIRDRINSTVKRRPSYQPFCPSILEEERERLFADSFPHKHMAIAFRMRPEFHSKLPSAIHIDGTARPQFLEEPDNPQYYRFLKEVKNLTGYGVVINTSFNLHGRTVVRTAEDSIIDFIDCNIDYLYLEGYKISRLHDHQ